MFDTSAMEAVPARCEQSPPPSQGTSTKATMDARRPSTARLCAIRHELRRDPGSPTRNTSLPTVLNALQVTEVNTPVVLQVDPPLVHMRVIIQGLRHDTPGPRPEYLQGRLDPIRSAFADHRYASHKPTAFVPRKCFERRSTLVPHKCGGFVAHPSLVARIMDVGTLFSNLYIETCCDMAALGLIVYEHAATFDREVALVWGRKFTGATMLFLLNRYLALVKYPISSYSIGLQPISTQSGLNWRLALLVLIPGLFPFAANIELYAHTIISNFPYPIGCTWTPAMSPHMYNSFSIAVRTCNIITDLLVLVITWWKTYGIRRAVANAKLKVSLSTLILRDGTIYFLISVLLVMNVLHIALTVSLRFTWIIALEAPLTTILVSRFLLNLREVDSGYGPGSVGDISYPSFVRNPDDAHGGNLANSFISPLGAPLQHGDDPETISTSNGNVGLLDSHGEGWGVHAVRESSETSSAIQEIPV
ncbi:hypothetical protein C8Q77DRAFT_1242693 [Trametes polyzona]|nr:hypothetical protein C8Q77DRAFT_1242693 [Trametes polyzona]